MRQRLSAKYGLNIKLPLAFIISLFPLIFTLDNNLLSWLPHSIYTTLIFYALLVFGTYKIVSYYLREKLVVEFDQDYLYITNMEMGYEESIPLNRIIHLKRHQGYFEAGSRWFSEHTLTYMIEYEAETKISFDIEAGDKNLEAFEKVTKSKNPEFHYNDGYIRLF
jgi:hypothetical protein